MATPRTLPTWATPASRASVLRRLRTVRGDLDAVRRASWPTPPADAPAPVRRPGEVAGGGLAEWRHATLDRPVAAAGTSLEVTGAEQLLVPGRWLLVANHQHPRDTELVLAALPQRLSVSTRVLAPAALRAAARLPRWLGPVTSAGAEALLVFGDGRPSPDGTVGDFDPAVGTLARRTGATVVPVAVRGSFALPARRPGPADLLEDGGLRVAVRFGTPLTELEGTDQEVAERVRDRVRALLDEDARTWWEHLTDPAAEPVPTASWRRVWSATAPATEGGSGTRRRIWR
ncbi:lysophospholipid acyltransferase family protein [Auraticoccus monumenti]|uniref:1-acyl-sn-glycerol-3-phosphate acyltransferase n=1 Tax=Auraticoccus monumenti TaxID=675864 RepID=A0A1G7B7W6_9ACTN|nr:hypothetical protein [Auraticoccus monumenti]SDE22930.1 1-acyl-sn-glycerol-3-phosphate acyltransferase [Auraticoccus monumenti]